MIGSVHAVIWQAGTNWAGPVRIQICYGPECDIKFMLDQIKVIREQLISLHEGRPEIMLTQSLQSLTGNLYFSNFLIIILILLCVTPFR